MGTKTYTGGCHCGRVRFEAKIDLEAGTSQCNCSICTKMGRWSAVLKPEAFTLLEGESELSDYEFATKSGHHVFCKHCGIHSYGYGDVPGVLGVLGKFVAVNVRCLDEVDLPAVRFKKLDGRAKTWAEIP